MFYCLVDLCLVLVLLYYFHFGESLAEEEKAYSHEVSGIKTVFTIDKQGSKSLEITFSIDICCVKRCCADSSKFTCQNALLLEIKCHGLLT